MPTYDPSNAECLVYVYREGLASAVGHDLEIEVTDFRIEVGDDGAVDAEFAADSLRVRHAVEDRQPRPGKLSAKDKKKIERNIQKDVLETKRFPVINFKSTEVQRTDGRVRVDGVLSLHGVERNLGLDGRVDGDQTVAEVGFDQRDFDIAPYKALLGALKLKPRVDVVVRVPFVPSE
jgi:hypothetical protein